MNIGSHLAAVLSIGTIGAAFGSLSAALVQVVGHAMETAAVHRAARRKFHEPPHSRYACARFWAALAAGMAYTLGLVLVLGGDARVSASAYSGIGAYGGHVVWGAVFMGVAVFTWVCAWRWHRFLGAALIVQALPFAGIAVMFALAAVEYPDANLTAAPIYGWIMVLHACLADYARRQY